MDQPGELRNASTVILLRDGAAGIEVFMMRRHIRSDFVGGAYVFPGGVVDPSDRIADSRCTGLDDTAASGVLGLPEGGLAYWVAGIRECFEEAGVMLAYDRNGATVGFDDLETGERFRRYRDALNRRDLTFEEILEQEGLRLATDRLHYWAHWVTPAGQLRRYDTRFFLALAPDRQTALHDGWELTDSAWVRPRVALQRAETREWTIIFPTLRNLERICDYTRAEDVERMARTRGPVARIQPRVVRDAEGIHLLIPGDPGYESPDESLDATEAVNYSDPGARGDTGP